ncbi:hypothetical protein [Glaciecola petra]|uniref:Uncharacterized protein n=1 Tax=Glaciecola petra TaxID=3075602 RepID=A0ABU2ZMZ9_9ALTE|nr:hypothetical protein [Aestuariibacter sp. P117]MDT0593997.1 hypothetical protein [Aestuariibacter sp. P117]
MPYQQILILIMCTFFLYACQSSIPDQEPNMTVVEDNNEKPQKTLTLVGYIRYQNIEGGFFGFIDSKGEAFTLINLPKAHLVDGLMLEIKGNIIKDYATTTQFGSVLNVSQSTVLGKDQSPPSAKEL